MTEFQSFPHRRESRAELKAKKMGACASIFFYSLGDYTRELFWSSSRHMDKIPTESDWRSEPWDLDIPYAYEHFAGKSHDEAKELFVDDALNYSEDVMFMPFACFPYYLNAYMAYLQSEDAHQDSAGASCFFGVIVVRIEDVKNAHPLLKESIVQTLNHLAYHQKWYDAEEDIYGSFRSKASQLINIIDG